jgi:hypothetical protein
MSPSDGKPLTLFARGTRGVMIGGLIGSTSYGWLLVKMLWVAEELRGHGLETQLMVEAGPPLGPAVVMGHGSTRPMDEQSGSISGSVMSRLGFCRIGLERSLKDTAAHFYPSI